MTKEDQLTGQKQREAYAIDVISQMLYNAKINVDYLDMAYKYLKQSNLKDTVLLYAENQKNWQNRLMRSLRGFSSGGVDIAEAMQKDLDGVEIYALFDTIRHLKSVRDIEGVADLVAELSDLDDITPVKTNLIAIIRNEKTRQGC